MSLERYELLAQVGAGPDGVSYQARPAGTPDHVEVRVLSGAHADPLHWPALSAKLRRARLLDHRGAVRVLELDLEHSPPFLALQWQDGPTLAERQPLSLTEGIAWGLDLCEVLLAAHRLGVAHGRLAPSAVRLVGAGRLMLDFTGTCTAGAPPRPAGDDPAEDVAGWATLLGGLLAGRQGAQTSAPLQTLLRAMQADDPAARPSLGAVRERLLALRADLAEPDPLGATNVALSPSPGRPGGTTSVGPQPGRRLGRFLLLEKLGQGGQGEVYKARDEGDGQVVAIKVLRPEWAARPEALARFRKEARLLGEVRNPHV